MVTTDKSKPVLVTGATGYVAGWIIKKLLDEGITVHATVRNPNDASKLAHLNALAAASKGNIQYFKADLLDEGSFAEAMKGCELVYHTASPFFTDVKDAQKELIEPAVLGTRNVLEQAGKTSSVKRIVLTSSCAAIYTDCTDVQNTPNGMLTEEIWNTTSSLDYQPYSYSKTLAEQEAWKNGRRTKPMGLGSGESVYGFGPALNPKTATSESISILKQMGDGTFRPGVPNIGMGVVDVRDLAEAHFKAGFTPEAHGRNIIRGHNTNMLELAQILHKSFGNQYKVPNSALPKWLLMLVGPMVNKILTRRYLRNNVNHVWKADNSKSIKELGMQYRPLEQTMNDAFQTLIDHQVIQK